MHAKCVRSAELAAHAEARGRPDRLVELRRRLDVGDADPEVVDVAAVRSEPWWTASMLFPSGSSRKAP